ncbi:hypothetical protein EXIGLDRAFT_615390, partial [Exidia glandulosa HHB12029]
MDEREKPREGSSEAAPEPAEKPVDANAPSAGTLPGAPSSSSSSLPVRSDSPELDPPATAEVPDPTVYPGVDLETILDLSPDVPADVRKRALELLRRHEKAFGFDGRLGHLSANAKVRTKEGVEPISVPMHGASPEKKAVIEEQLKKWFELGVIEDSISPWAAPVVIVYRNGKPRF